jgi:hypothetical protein
MQLGKGVLELNTLLVNVVSTQAHKLQDQHKAAAQDACTL